ncbi:3-oxoacyl-ACP synthase [Streptomyces broussonetiae]|uniref:3-oxoacyl-ACP synthase n=1 Tax=Streptomyces broussonetiae TaxID=2686304 RepID=A0A6I6MUN4_9ACTN|nr:ketoacyl-ACP synthase III family protein [Streptomyces broussonetiae]QHA03142.1 3-oxoacyl-ACP synthase [Streptomyces broussonetiae]
MRTRGIYLAGVGVFLPAAQSIESAVEQGLVPAGRAAEYDLSGVAVAGRLAAPEMALAAAQEALKDSGMSAEDIGLLLYTGVWHQGPDGWGPQAYLQRHLLGDNLLAVEIRNGCNGTFSALELAAGYLKASPGIPAALVTASDNFGTRLIDRWSPGDGVSYLGDGASAVVLSTAPGFAELRSLCSATFSEMEEAHRGEEPLFPPNVTAGTALDYGARAASFQRKAEDDGSWVRLLLGHQRHNLECTGRALAEAGVAAGDISRVLIHGMPRQAAASYLKVLGFSLEQSTWDFSRTVGHLGASDHMAALHHLLSTSRLEAGDHVLLCGFSPGVTYKAAVIRILSTDPTRKREAQASGL